MELSAYDLALIAGGFGIAGVLLGSLCTYRLSLHLADKQFQHLKTVARMDAWHVAVAKFRKAFAADLHLLESEMTPTDVDIVTFLERPYEDRHRSALAEFSHHLQDESRPAFLAEWHRYCFGTDSNGEPMSLELLGMKPREALFLHCYPNPSSGSATDPNAYAAKQVRRLLSFASDASPAVRGTTQLRCA